VVVEGGNLSLFPMGPGQLFRVSDVACGCDALHGCLSEIMCYRGGIMLSEAAVMSKLVSSPSPQHFCAANALLLHSTLPHHLFDFTFKMFALITILPFFRLAAAPHGKHGSSAVSSGGDYTITTDYDSSSVDYASSSEAFPTSSGVYTITTEYSSSPLIYSTEHTSTDDLHHRDRQLLQLERDQPHVVHDGLLQLKR
jgi:hypothetical protein